MARVAMPVGAESGPDGVRFRVWAPDAREVAVLIEASGKRRPHALRGDDRGYFAGTVADAQPGTRYWFRLDGGEPTPDPASRYQPEGPHGPSEVIDPGRFEWTDAAWPGITLKDQVIYELHIGTFTAEGTFAAAEAQIPALADLGVTCIEVMPVAEFPGRFGWGYDGVGWFAPTRLYGNPDDFRRFVDRAHAAGIGVILDVVYNHFGPDGNYLKRFSRCYFSDRYDNEWGEALNFDAAGCEGMRELVIANAEYWIREFHLDGLRLDATQQIFDQSEEHIIREISRAARRAAAGRSIIIVGENEPQEARLVRSAEQGGYELDALWNDDFHHSAMAALTGRNEAYYSDHAGTAQELLSALKWGFLFQGQRYRWQKKRRGQPALDLPPERFIVFLENHDQVANTAFGRRAHALASPARFRALTAMLLLAPGTPMLFQGQEFASSKPFLYFADHGPDLAPLVRKGREEFLSQFPSIATTEVRELLHDPADLSVFERSKLDHSEREKHRPVYELHRDLLRLRRLDPVIAAARHRGGFDGALLGESAFLLRYFGKDDDRLILVNLGRDLHMPTAPEPLLAPRAATGWRTLWSSESPRYGGSGTAAIEHDEGWHLPAETTVVLASQRTTR